TSAGVPLSTRGVLRRRWAVLATALIITTCLLGGLAAAGVFSGSHQNRSPATTATSSALTTTTTPRVSQTRPALAAPADPLKPGDQGAAVTLLQRALAHLGYTP